MDSNDNSKTRSCDRVFADFKLYQLYNIIHGGEWGSNRATAGETVAFLASAKNLLAAGKYDFVTRRKNMLALAQHGLTILDAKDEILGLMVGDYYKGPKRDLDSNRSGDIWEFKKNIDGIRFYVKLKIVRENGGDVLKCLGFHEDEYA